MECINYCFIAWCGFYCTYGSLIVGGLCIEEYQNRINPRPPLILEMARNNRCNLSTISEKTEEEEDYAGMHADVFIEQEE